MTSDEVWGCPDHPFAGYIYHPIRGQSCTTCGQKIDLLKVTFK